jgi:hypothetical protein
MSFGSKPVATTLGLVVRMIRLPLNEVTAGKATATSYLATLLVFSSGPLNL